MPGLHIKNDQAQYAWTAHYKDQVHYAWTAH